MNKVFDDQLSLDQGIRNNAIDAQWFLPFIIYRLQPYAGSRQLVMTVNLQRILTEPIVTRRLLLTWAADTPTITSPPIQDSVITE